MGKIGARQVGASWPSAHVLVLALCTLWSSSACSDSTVDDRPRADLITVEEVTVTRAVEDESSILFFDVTLHNQKDLTFNYMHHATFSASQTKAAFDLTLLVGANRVVRCPDPEPWDVPPREEKAVRFRIDFREDPAEFMVACVFDPDTPGINFIDSVSYTAPREGPALADDFQGPVSFDLRATMNADCTPKDCPTQATIRGGGEVSP